MSLDLEGTSSQYAYNTAPIFTDQPFTISCWLKRESNGNPASTAGLFDSGTTNHFHHLDYGGGSGIMRAGSAAGGTQASAAFGSDPGTAVWYHALAHFGPTSGTDRAVSVNGGTFVTSGTNRAATGLDRFMLGANYNAGTPISFWDGLVAMCAIWNVQLNQGECTGLANGAHPLEIRPGSMVALYPLVNNEKDYTRNQKHLTLNGSPSFSTDQPPVRNFPGRPVRVPYVVAAPAVFVPRIEMYVS